MKDASDPRLGVQAPWLRLSGFLLIAAIGCGSGRPVTDPPSESKTPVDRPSTTTSRDTSDEPESFLESLADLITPDVVAVGTVAPNKLPKNIRDDAVLRWERIAKELGLPSSTNGLERVSLLVGAPRDITFDWHARSGAALVFQFDDEAAATRFAEKVILVRGQLPIPMLFLDGDGLADELRSPVIDWTLHSQGAADWWQWRTQHDLALFRASPTTFTIGASRIVGTMGQRREFLPLRRQILQATPSSIAAAFVDLSNDSGWLFQIQRAEIREMKRRAGWTRQQQESESAPFAWHAQVLSPISRLNAEWFDRATNPVTVGVTYSPVSHLDHRTTPGLRQTRLAVNQRDGAAYGKILQDAILGPGNDPILKTVSPPDAVLTETTWKLTLTIPANELADRIATHSLNRFKTLERDVP